MPNRRSLLVTAAALALVAVALGSAHGVRRGDEPSSNSTPAADGSAAPSAPAGTAPEADDRSGTKQPTGDETTGSSDPEPTAASSAAPEQPPSTAAEPEPAAPSSGDPLPGLDAASDPPAADFDPPDEMASARGRLVTGYPTRLLPLAPRSAVVSSSVAPSVDRVQVALVGRRTSAGPTVLRFYRSTLGTSGFREMRTRAIGGAQAAAFRRGEERVVVTVDPSPTRTYSVYATLVVPRG